MSDRAMQALHLLALEPIAETTADNVSSGFRKYRNTHDAMSHIFNILAKKNAGSWVLEGDIKGCFDHIQHQWLLDHTLMDRNTHHVSFFEGSVIFLYNSPLLVL
jgi:RNA-directed DNA polymerase